MPLTNEELNVSLVRIEGRFERVEALMEDVSHALTGNGRPGLIEAAVRLDERVSAIEGARSAETAHRAMPRSVWVPLLLSTLLGLAGLVTSVATALASSPK
jgi:hypothetical protein